MKRSTCTLALALAGALATSNPRPAAADDSKIKGLVHDEKGTPLADAVIHFDDTKSGHKYTIKTGKDGSFYQRGIFPSAAYTMKVEKEGYTAHILDEVQVPAGYERSFDLKLESVEARSAEVRKEKFGEAYGTGLEAFQKGDYEKALASAEETIAKKPEEPKGYEMKSAALIGLKRYAEAIPVLEKQQGMANAQADLKKSLAVCQFNAGVQASQADKPDEAIARWEKALQLEYEDPVVEYYLGQAYLDKQEYDKAKTHLAAYIAKKPNASEAGQVKALLDGLQKLGDKK